MSKCAVYRHYDASGNLLYVGLSSCPISRTGQHKRTASWYSEIETISIVWLSSRDDAIKYEAAAIASECPLNNTRWVRSRPSVKGNKSPARVAMIKVRVTPEEKEAFEAVAKELGLTVSEIVRGFMDELVDQHEQAGGAVPARAWVE